MTFRMHLVTPNFVCPHAIGAKTFGNLTGPKTISTQRNYRYQFIVSSFLQKKKNMIITDLAFFFSFSFSCYFSLLYSLPHSLFLLASLSLLRSLAFLSLTFFLSLFLSYSLVWTHTGEGTAVCTDTCRSIYLLWCLQVSHTKLAQDRRSRYYLIDRITETTTICKYSFCPLPHIFKHLSRCPAAISFSVPFLPGSHQVFASAA